MQPASTPVGMTYLAFHAVFTLPAALGLLALGWRRKVLTRRRAGALALITGLAVLYTTPWDRHLVLTGVWGYGPDRVLVTLAAVPVEEYAFFVLQPLLTGAWLFVRLGPEPVRWWDDAPRNGRASVSALWAGVTAAGLVLLPGEPTRYLGLTLAWAGPVLFVQSAYGAHQLRARWRLVAAAVGAPTLYLWLADRVAIELGVWHLSDRFTTGAALLGLPVEEALFFLLTNLMVVQGVLLALAATERHRRRTRAAAA